MSDDERTAAEVAESGDDPEYKPYGALAVTVFLAAVIVGFWALVFILTQVRG